MSPFVWLLALLKPLKIDIYLKSYTNYTNFLGMVDSEMCHNLIDNSIKYKVYPV